VQLFALCVPLQCVGLPPRLLPGDPFEQLVNAYLDNRSRRLAARLGSGVRSGISRFTAFVKKHRRTESQQHLPGFLNGGSSSAAGGFGGGGGLGATSGFGGGLSGLADSPEVQRLKQLAAAFASAAVGAGQMRRNLTEGSNLGECSAGVWRCRCMETVCFMVLIVLRLRHVLCILW
jgi:hypothetical protein